MPVSNCSTTTLLNPEALLYPMTVPAGTAQQLLLTVMVLFSPPSQM
jgi:hypothetical protein